MKYVFISYVNVGVFKCLYAVLTRYRVPTRKPSSRTKHHGSVLRSPDNAKHEALMHSNL